MTRRTRVDARVLVDMAIVFFCEEGRIANARHLTPCRLTEYVNGRHLVTPELTEEVAQSWIDARCDERSLWL